MPRNAAHPTVLASVLAALPVALTGQHATQSQDPKAPMYVAEASEEAREAIRGFRLERDLEVALVASEPLLCNVVAFQVTTDGRIYVSETNRIKDGVFDNREYMRWKDEDLACTTVAERVAKYERHLDDIERYSAYAEQIRLLTDEDGDGIYDNSSVFAGGFADMADGIASGVLEIGGDVWFTNIPKLWRLRDTDGDGIVDVRDGVFDGFGVHTSLIGHDLHGLILGPDRRLYFSIGDRGFNVVNKEGERLFYPHEGAVLRCELDGSDLEVVHRGLRNPQELAFDDLGNLFTGDNNSDGGDRARLVHVVDGADSGWRIGFQWLSDRGSWNREKMWWPHHDEQAAWILPPILNIADGPSGLAFDPGVGLPERYRGCLFLCDFRGGAAYSGVHALRLERKGAGFELVQHQRPIWSVLCTDIDFGADGSLYVLDWVHGWNKSGKGRVHRVTRKGQRNDAKLRANARLLNEDLTKASEAQLLAMLAHPDRRVRQRAQFALVDRGAQGSLTTAAKDVDQRSARLHGIWGLGILGRKNPETLESVLPLLDDGDADVRAQTARVLGDGGYQPARENLLKRLEDSAQRVRFEAALALYRLGMDEPHEDAVSALVKLLRDNADRDPVLRHAAVMGLSTHATTKRLRSAKGAASPAVRLGALLALRQRRDAGVADFLGDVEIRIRREAARAIFDGEIDAALPALAETLSTQSAHDEPLAWRALNACRHLGKAEHAQMVARYAADATRPIAGRVEAIKILAEWPTPHGQDRIVGNWRPCEHEDATASAQHAAQVLPGLLDGDAKIATAAAEACGKLGITAAAPALAELVKSWSGSADARTAALKALDALQATELDDLAMSFRPEDPVPLRKAAVQIFARRDPAKAAPVLASLCERAVLPDRQAAFAALGELDNPAAIPILTRWLDDLIAGKVDVAVQLDLLEAAGKRQEPEIQAKLRAYEKALNPADPLARFRVCIEGGDRNAGRSVFYDNEATRCTRCHTLQDQGGNAGPNLDRIGSQRSRDHLIESLVLPSQQIADGFATTVVDLHNGEVVAGVATKDQDGVLEIVDVTGQLNQIPWDRIKARKTSTESAMPAMGGTLTLRQLRDVVAFLAAQQKR